MLPAASPEVSEHLATQRYFDRAFDRAAVKVLPGEYYVSATDEVIVTVLGSCVAACIRDVRLGVGGLNHFMLPSGGAGSQVSSASARYGVFAMEVLVNHLFKLGARREHLEAKVFGGGKVVASLSRSEVGARNAAFVRHYLATEEIALVAEDLMDDHARKVVFFPATGRVLVKRVGGASHSAELQREQRYQRRLQSAPIAGEVELFDTDLTGARR
ncbi:MULTISPECIES: chemoreceptor glutamine deamidase CheD [Denitromonas]|uniref:Probable chemoreceptor glutamine deamidase CheD n=2 Tax=Denitromonas TaxID=139331 RepID=A0A557R3Q0_9RHOO|nr:MULTISPECIES: chemoreceptor glutamine deamidase CheD [Denitromonas]TVO59768.1 chemoreceptor glutamine deamidase CheD [Denitromonas halophila]TVO69073.1 chemoreceptor glutamine deamidase CheD [Denitromonas ohlonensis]TVO77173.1 chemoreceptor glutamine deamidase CheD [Denitromonas ohlonensis]